MAKIGTAHVEIKPVVNDEALIELSNLIEQAVTRGVRAGIESAMSTTISTPVAVFAADATPLRIP